MVRYPAIALLHGCDGNCREIQDRFNQLCRLLIGVEEEDIMLTPRIIKKGEIFQTFDFKRAFVEGLWWQRHSGLNRKKKLLLFLSDLTGLGLVSYK